MNENLSKHLIHKGASVRDALKRLNELSSDAILFVTDDIGALLGSLTDGDLRRGFINGLDFDSSIMEFVQDDPKFIVDKEVNLNLLDEYKNRNFKIIPILTKSGIIKDILNFRIQSSLIPVDAIMMAGGEGKRLRPLTENTPKPLLKVGDKPIIEHNIDRLKYFGIKRINISINYLGDQLIQHFGDGTDRNLIINYVKEKKPLGTIGSVKLIKEFDYEDVFVMNSDVLTNIDYLDFYRTFKESNADMAVAAISYDVNIPYAVLEVGSSNEVKSLKEKPKYTYYSNAGIYFIKKELLQLIPDDSFYDITDLMDQVIIRGLKLIAYPINGYWLDIGKHEDFKRAQEDINHIKF